MLSGKLAKRQTIDEVLPAADEACHVVGEVAVEVHLLACGWVDES